MRGRARRTAASCSKGSRRRRSSCKKREAERPIIIALTVGGEEHSTVNSDHVLDQLRKSGAILHVFSVERSALRSTVNAANPRDLLQENMHLNRVLGDGPKQSGGRHQSIVASTGFIMGLQSLAAELTTQYRIRYTLPAGAKKSERLNISIKRKNTVVRAPSKLRHRQVRSQKSEVKSQKDSDGNRFYFRESGHF